MGGFDGARAYEHVRQLVALGPRPSGSEALHRAQAHIVSQLKSYGCPVEEHDFHGSTDLGEIAMKNIIAKIPGTGPNIVMYATHYDTVRIPNFVGADDGGSGTGTMLELARLLCPRKGALNVWIVFFDGEEAQGQWTSRESVQWTATDSTYGSREMAASMAMSGVVLLFMAVAGRSPAFALFVAVLGFFLFATRSVLQAWLLESTPKHLAGTTIGLLFGAQAVGAAIGPFIGGVIADHYGITATFYYLAATIVIANLFILITPAETPKETRQPGTV